MTPFPYEKCIRDGKVAVLYSPGFGAGWSTWADDDIRDFVLFDRRLVECLEAGGDVAALTGTILDGIYMYTGGARNLTIHWLPVGARFIVNEYDGSESIQEQSGDYWREA